MQRDKGITPKDLKHQQAIFCSLYILNDKFFKTYKILSSYRKFRYLAQGFPCHSLTGWGGLYFI